MRFVDKKEAAAPAPSCQAAASRRLSSHAPHPPKKNQAPPQKTTKQVETGTPIVPVYHFGNTAVFDFGPSFLMPHARRLGAALGVLIGRWGLPVPRRVPLMMVSGKAIPVERVARDDPRFHAVVDETHARVVKELQELYERNRAAYDPAWADRPLSIE